MKIRHIFSIIILFSLFGCGDLSSNDGDKNNSSEDNAPLTVSFNSNGGTIVFSQKVAVGGKATEPQNIIKTDNILAGWYKDNNSFQSKWNFELDEVGENITLYAKWEVTTYTVIFNLNGGNGLIPDSRKVAQGFSTALPASENLSLIYAAFTGWNTKADGSGTNYLSSYTPTGNTSTIILYAQWDITPLNSIEGLNNKLDWLEAHAKSNGNYTIEIDADEEFYYYSLNYNDRTNITITLKGVGTNRTITAWSQEAAFKIGSGVTLILDGNITITHYGTGTYYYGSGVYVDSGGTFIMNGGTITGNTGTRINNTIFSEWWGHYGGGVYVNNGGKFTMNGGNITGNTANNYMGGSGGGVFVSEYAIFNMTGGTISNNSACNGGGVCVDGTYMSGGVFVNGTFNMSGGEISNNSSMDGGDGAGGGVFVNGNFTMSGSAKINNNTSPNLGGGVFVGGTFIMNGGEISDNTSDYYGLGLGHGGGGVFVNGNFTMNNGSISGNTAGFGGGVFVGSESFLMNGGTITGNTAYSNGGGVYIGSGRLYMYIGNGRIFDKKGGTVTGYASDPLSGNVVMDWNNRTIINNCGHAIYAETDGSVVRKESTAGSAVNLFFNNGVISGNWD